MTTPIYLDKADPATYTAMLAVAQQASDSARALGLSRTLIELVNLRVSQINGCAYCLDMHTKRAVRYGEDPRRLGVLPAWRDAELFTEQERAALTLAEAVTTLPEQRDAIHAEVSTVLSEAEFAAIGWLAITMNAFNRLSITSRHPVRPAAPDESG